MQKGKMIMRMLNWARKEIEIACKRERGNSLENEWDYGCACYESALKAFEALCGDGHSGMSISITKAILNRLIDGKSLTPIEDAPDVWKEVSFGKDNVKTYQCKRMSSLFKDVYPDGTVKYNDNNRVSMHNINSGASCHCGRANEIANEKYPITMPYVPLDKPIIVYADDFDSINNEVGCYDHQGFYYMVHPNGERTEINRFFKETNNGDVEITKAEYEASRPKEPVESER